MRGVFHGVVNVTCCGAHRANTGVLPIALANRVGFQTHEIDIRRWPFAQEGPPQCEGLAGGKTVCGLADRAHDPHCRSYFPLGLYLGSLAAAAGARLSFFTDKSAL